MDFIMQRKQNPMNTRFLFEYYKHRWYASSVFTVNHNLQIFKNLLLTMVLRMNYGHFSMIRKSFLAYVLFVFLSFIAHRGMIDNRSLNAKQRFAFQQVGKSSALKLSQQNYIKSFLYEIPLYSCSYLSCL